MKKMNNLSSGSNTGATYEYKKTSTYGVIIVKWNKKKILYSEKQLKDIFLRFGKIEFIRIGSKQKSAILQFFHLSSAKLAYEYFSSPLNKRGCKLTVILKNSTSVNINAQKQCIDNERKQTSGTDTTTTTNINNCNNNDNIDGNKSSNTKVELEQQDHSKNVCRKFNSFEDDVMARLQKAAGV